MTLHDQKLLMQIKVFSTRIPVMQIMGDLDHPFTHSCVSKVNLVCVSSTVWSLMIRESAYYMT